MAVRPAAQLPAPFGTLRHPPPPACSPVSPSARHPAAPIRPRRRLAGPARPLSTARHGRSGAHHPLSPLPIGSRPPVSGWRDPARGPLMCSSALAAHLGARGQPSARHPRPAGRLPRHLIATAPRPLGPESGPLRTPAQFPPAAAHARAPPRLRLHGNRENWGPSRRSRSRIRQVSSRVGLSLRGASNRDSLVSPQWTRSIFRLS